jgi:hypothetical protein
MFNPGSACFDFYGLGIDVSSADADLVGEVQRDFAFFHRPSLNGAGERFALRLHVETPSFAGLPDLPAAFLTPRNVCYRDTTRTYIDYYGRALGIFERGARAYDVYGTDPEMLHEIAYLFILSTVGEYLDARGIHRLHALGVSLHGRGILLLLPSGGGKSTMALELMRHPDFRLLGEDTPLIDRDGRILPFPLRMGVRPDSETGVPPQYLRTVRRMEFDPKTLIDIEYFRDRLGGAADPALILVGERHLGESSAIVPLARRKAFKAMTKYMIVGLGVYQGMEFLLERGVWEVAGRLGVATSRLVNSVRLLRRAPTYRFILGRDRRKNFETLVTFLTRDAAAPGAATAVSERGG